MSTSSFSSAAPTQAESAWKNAAAVVMVMTTAPDTLLAKRLAHELVEEHLAACAHVGSTITAMYMWQGKLEGGEEVPVSFKTSVAAVPALLKRIREMHPYQVPELLVVPVLGGDAAYLAWVQEQTASASVQPGAGSSS